MPGTGFNLYFPRPMRYLNLQLRILCVLCCLNVADRSYAEAFIESVIPPVLQRGVVNRVHLRGSGMTGATGLWTSLPQSHLTVRQTADSTGAEAVFEIELTGQVPLGLYGLRLATHDGLSNVHLFAVDQLAHDAELESVEGRANDELDQAQPVRLPRAIFGTCQASDVDHFRFDAQRGQRVAFEVVGSRLGKGFDPVLTILDSEGNFIAERDNDIGLFFDCRFEHTFERAGAYIVQLHDTRFEGSTHWSYLLRMGNFPVARVALPSTGRPGAVASVLFPQSGGGRRNISFPEQPGSRRFFLEFGGDPYNSSTWLPFEVSAYDSVVEAEPNETPAEPNPVPVPSNIHGLIDRAGDSDCYALELKRGQRISVRSSTRELGSAADIELTVLAPDGKTIKTVDDNGFDDAALEFTAAADGRHLLQVLEVVRKYGPEYVYRLEVSERQPAIGLRSEIGRIALAQGSWQPLPLQLNYTDFKGPVELSLVGAPAGLGLRESTVAAGAGEFAGALVADPSTAPGVYTIQVVASAQQATQALRAVASVQPLVDRLPTGRGPHGEPFELREDQRRLPPSVTDRIAVVVLPAAPFDFEIATAEVVLPRYTEAEFKIVTTRAAGFGGPIEFVARGGLLDYDRLRMPSVRAEIPPGTAEQLELAAKLRSGVNTNLTKHRVTVTGTARHKQRVIHLTRTFQLEVKVAFRPSAQPAKLDLRPGGKARVQLLANRLSPFDGELTVRPTRHAGIGLPESLVIPAGRPAIEVELELADDVKPGSYKIKLPGSARIDKFFEEGPGQTLEIVVPAASD